MHQVMQPQVMVVGLQQMLVLVKECPHRQTGFSDDNVASAMAGAWRAVHMQKTAHFAD